MLGADRSSTFRRLGWVGCGVVQPGIRQLTTGGDQRGEALESPRRASSTPLCPRVEPAAQQGGGEGPAAARPRPLRMPTLPPAASSPSGCPPGVPGAAGLPWAPGGPPRHGGCAPRLSGGRGRSHGHSSHAALGPGPPHTAHRSPPRCPSPVFSAALALTLRTGHRTRSPQGHGPCTMTRPPVSLNTGP